MKMKANPGNLCCCVNPEYKRLFNNKPDLLAIEAVIEYICESSDEEFMIITDSLSSLQALKRQKLNNPIVSNFLHMFHFLSGHKDIVFCWVPSHIGIQGNERADVLASAALDLHLIPFLNYSGIPLQVLLFSSYRNVTYIICFNY